MFVISRDVSAAKKVIATLLATALVMYGLGYATRAEAANVTNVYDLLSDTAPGAGANHEIQFVTPTGVAATETITVTFPAGFNLGSITEDDVDFDIGGTPALTAAAPSGATWGVAVAGQVLTITSGTGTVAPSTTIQIRIGTNAVDSGTGANQIANPSTPANGNESYEIAIAGTMTDSGYTRVVILDTVLVTAQVLTSFDFTVYGLATSTDVNGEATTLTTSSTTIPFGVLTSLTPKVGAQDLTVSTNARNGFVVTVQTDGQLRSSTGADIDKFKDDVIAAPAAWESPSVGLDINDENTWGHWGITSEDSDLNTDEFGNNLWAGITNTPREVFSHDGSADGVTADIGSTTVGFKIEISALQEAADDYQTVLTYIATPTF